MPSNKSFYANPHARFVHLRVHTEYSISDSIVRIEELIKAASVDSQAAIGVADLGNLFAWIKFYQAARAHGLKPICSVDIWVTHLNDEPQALFDSSPVIQKYRMQLMATNQAGYLRLCQLLSRAWLQESDDFRGVFRANWFSQPRPDGSSATEGLIALSGAHLGDVGQALLSGDVSRASGLAEYWNKIFPNSYYLEIQRTENPDSYRHTRAAVRLSAKMLIPVVATHPVQFISKQAHLAHEVRVCIAQGKMLSDPNREQKFTADQYFKTQLEMAELFSDLPVALKNSVEIAKRCNLQMVLGKFRLPDFPIPENASLSLYFREKATVGLRARLFSNHSPEIEQLDSVDGLASSGFPEQEQNFLKKPSFSECLEHYQSRLDYECDVIIQMGFAGYFLIVADFIEWAKNNGVPVGPGRGSGAGSLVAFALGVTDLDPLPYSLLFERFLNPERVSMPDFDVDFCQEQRYRVIDYVRQKYGESAVSQIVTFGRMASRAVVRDVGRVLGMSYNFCDQLSKLIPVVQNKPMPLAQARVSDPTLSDRVSKEVEVRELFFLAEQLEDITRNVGMHAGGVLIAPGNLSDFCPLYKQPDTEGVISQFDKDDVESIGLVKFDFLGLRNLTVIDLTLHYIRIRHPDFKEDLSQLKFDDPAAFKILKEANTIGVFQLESEGMRKLLKKLLPDRFEDIIAVLALYRPGPLGSGMVDDFILRKKGQQKINYFHPDLTQTLEPTYGVIIYQEQVMQIAQIIGGYTLGSADLLRRAMGKKKSEEMSMHREIFVEGAKKRNYAEDLANKLFDLMAMFAEYGFNKSHTAAYAVITYQTAWLKASYPAEFMAATLSLDMHDTDKIEALVHDTKENGIDILPPDVNSSKFRFEAVSDRSVSYGLGAIKGLGSSAIDDILRARVNGKFLDLFDFCSRVDRRVVNKRALEALIRSGAFDSIDGNRAKYLANISRAIEFSENSSALIGQGQLFPGVRDAAVHSKMGRDDSRVEWLHVPAWDERECLQEERVALGFPLTGHLFHGYQKEVRQFIPVTLARATIGSQPQWITGVVVGIRAQMTRRGKMAFVTVDDDTDRLDVAIFNELYVQNREAIQMDSLLVCSGKISLDSYSGTQRLSADKVFSLAQARQIFGKKIQLDIEQKTQPNRQANELCDAMRSFIVQNRNSATENSGLSVSIQYTNSIWRCVLNLGWYLYPVDEMFKSVRCVEGVLEAKIIY